MKTRKKTIKCYLCENVIDEEPSRTEDGCFVHKSCLQSYNSFWDDRNEMLDLMGY